MSAETQIQQIIDFAQGQASEAAEEAKNLANDAVTASMGGIIGGPSLPPLPEIPDIVLPPPPVPSGADTYRSWFDDFMNQLIPDFDARFDSLISTYFPDVTGCIRDASDDWICNTILYGGTGIPAAVEDQIWERARSRELAEGERQRGAAVGTFANRGFPLPPGALVAALSEVDLATVQRVSTVSRETAIKNVEIEIENIRFAVAQATQLRLGAINAAVNYIAAWAGIVGAAAQMAEAQQKAEAAYYAAIAAYYNAVYQAYRLPLERGKISGDWAIQQYATDIQAMVSERQSRIGAALSAAQAMGSMAAAALAGQNSFASLNKNTAARE